MPIFPSRDGAASDIRALYRSCGAANNAPVAESTGCGSAACKLPIFSETARNRAMCLASAVDFFVVNDRETFS